MCSGLLSTSCFDLSIETLNIYIVTFDVTRRSILEQNLVHLHFINKNGRLGGLVC